MKILHLNKRNILLTIFVSIVLLLPFMVGAADSDPAGEGEAMKELSWLQSGLWSLVSTVFGFFVTAGGMLLNIGVTKFVVGFGEQFTDFGIGFAVNNLWVVMRDFFNLFFIFGLVYIGFQMILKSGDTNARRLLVHIILAALLVNFSLFFTKVIIDFGNIAATQIANAFPEGTVAGDIGVADTFMNVLGLQGTLAGGDAVGLNAINQAGGYTYILGTMILYIIMAFVFAAGGILLLIRFIVLNIYMILSPLMFLGWVFPALASYSAAYWKAFLGRVFFAPAYLLMVYFAFVVLDSFASLLTNTSNYSEMFQPGAGAIASISSTLPFFIFTAVFLIAAIVVGQKMGVEGANLAVSLGKGGARRIRSGATRVAISTANRTGGYVAHSAASSQGFRSFAARNKVGEYAHKATLAVGSGYEKRQKEKVENDKKYAEKLGEIKTRDPISKQLLPEIKTQIGTNIRKTINENQSYKKIESNRKQAENNIQATKASLTTKENELAKEKERNRVKLQDLENKLKKETDSEAKANIEVEIAKAKEETKASEDKLSSEVTTLGTTLKAQTTVLEKAKGDETDMLKNLTESEEGKIRFKNQLTLAERKERESETYSSSKTKAGAMATTAVVGGEAVGAMAVAPPVILAPVVTNSFASDAGASGRELRKIYGNDGVPKMRTEKKVKELRLQKDVEKELLGNNDGSSTKTEDKS